MKKLLYFAVIIALLFSTGPVNASDFTDVPEEHYSFEAVKNIKNLGIITGYTDGSFAPDKPITRAEMAAVICRMTEQTFPFSGIVPFSDVSEEHWAAGYIAKAFEKSIISGDEKGCFNPDVNIKYEEAIKMTVMAAGLGKNITPYPTDWSKAYTDIADTTKISEGLRGTKGEYASRADIAVMINNALKLKSNPNLMIYAKPLYNSSLQIPTNASFALDGNVFLSDNTMYSKELAKASAILSMTAYDYIYTDNSEKGHADTVLRDTGFENIRKINLADNYSDSNITGFYIGEKYVVGNNQKIRVIAVAIRGTNGTLKEWTSNFDIGSGDENELYTKENHKGYDITAQRVISEVTAYMSENSSGNEKSVLWFTGHSRGGSVANICAAYFGDAGTKCFAYTFGASKTTVKTNFSEYDYIFNTVNTDDLVTYIPMNQWGFNIYGKSAEISVSESLMTQWSEMTGLKKYNCKASIADTAAKMSECSPSRKDCYVYPDGGKIRIELGSEEECTEYQSSLLSSFAEASRPYCKFETVKAPEGSHSPYILEIYMQPAFLMQNIAAVMSGKIGVLNFLTLPLPDYLSGTHTAVISAYLGGLTHPHTPETYYVIIRNITAEDFR